MKTIDISWRRYILPNIHNEGWKFVGIFAAVTALLAMMWEPLGWIGIALTIWCFYFFRDPDRVTPEIEDVVVSPADGIVQMITKVKAPEELGLGDEKFTRVSVFMSVFNVHANRSPAEGKITKAVYVPGFLRLSSRGLLLNMLFRKNVNPMKSPISLVTLRLHSHRGGYDSFMSLLSRICFWMSSEYSSPGAIGVNLRLSAERYPIGRTFSVPRYS